MPEHTCYAGTAFVTPEARSRMYLTGTVGDTQDEAQKLAINHARAVIEDDFATRDLCYDCGLPLDNSALPAPQGVDAT